MSWASLSYGHWSYWDLQHKITVDYITRLIYVNDGVTEFDIKIDLYSDLKELWSLDPTDYRYNRFRPPVRVIGGDATSAGQFAGDIYFMQNGWRIVYDPTKTSVTGVLFSDDYDTPWLYSGDMSPVYPAQVSSLVTAVQPTLEGLEIPTPTETAEAVRTELNVEMLHLLTLYNGLTPAQQDALTNMPDSVWDKPVSEMTTSGSIGEWVAKKLLSLKKYIGLK